MHTKTDGIHQIDRRSIGGVRQNEITLAVVKYGSNNHILYFIVWKAVTQVCSRLFSSLVINKVETKMDLKIISRNTISGKLKISK